MVRNFPVLVAIETDATRFHGEHAVRPAPLDRGAAEQMLAHLASDLAALFSNMEHCGLTLAGALYDQTQILQPGYPVYRALESLARAPTDDGYQNHLVSIGAANGRMPVPELQPCAEATPGILQILPLLITAPEAEGEDLFESMEHRFMEEGQLSAHSAKGLEAGFGISVNHARFMTLTDLNAMLHLQLDHFGFLPLWKLLDAALENQPDPFLTQGSRGAVFRWDGTRALCRFETFDFWARHGSGRNVVKSERVDAYADWTREYRQYLVTLTAHAVPLAQYLPDQPEEYLEESFLMEVSDGTVHAGRAEVTEHSSADLGTIAVTVADTDRLINLYPLRAEGLNDLHAHLRKTGLTAGCVSFPGAICLDREALRLAQDRL